MSNTNLMTLKNQGLMPTVGSLDSYISAVNTLEVLEPEAEQELAHRLRDENDLQAAQQLVLSNLRFVVHVARGYMGYGLALADLIQEGNIGLMKAVKRFDPEVGVRLISFAVHWIRAEIHEYILKNWRIVKVATTKAQRKLFFNLRRSKKRLGWMNRSEVETVAKDLGVKPETVLQMERRLSSHDVGFASDNSDDDENPRRAPEDYLSSNADADPAHSLEAADWSQRQNEALQEGLRKLDDRSRDILQRRWLSDDKKTGLQALGDEYGVSAERIRQLEQASIKKLRRFMTTA